MNPFYAVWLACSGAVAALAAGVAWRRRSAPGAWALCILMLSLTVWSVTYAIYWLSSAPGRNLWLQATYLGAVTAPVAFFVLALFFSGRGGTWRRDAYLFLAVIPVLTLLLMWTDPWHGLFHGSHPLSDDGMIFSGGPWFYVNVVYSYGLMLAGAILLGSAYVHAQDFYRRQMRVMLAGALLPWVVNILMLFGWNPLPGLDLTPIAFTATGLLITYGFFG